MQDWLTVIIILLILGVLLDGLRRVRARRRSSLRMSRRVADDGSANGDDLSASEFPSGGARVAAYRDPNELENVNQHLRENYVASRMTRGAPRRIPDQVSLKLDKAVPMLMESVEDVPSEAEQSATARDIEPQLGSLEGLDDRDDATLKGIDEPSGEMNTAYDDEAEVAPYDTSYGADDVEDSDPPPTVDREDENDASTEDAGHPGRAPDEVLIINVMAKKGAFFGGQELLDAMVGQGLRYGDMDIFHRHESVDGSGKILFSVANIVVPGTFELGAMEDFETPGISMFLSLPVPGDSIAAFNSMVETAQVIVAQLDGELKDENRSVMTRQTIEHARQRVVEYERKRRLAR